MSYYDDAAKDQAANDSTVLDYIRRGQMHKAIQRIWEIVQKFAKVIDNVASVVNAVRVLFGI